MRFVRLKLPYGLFLQVVVGFIFDAFLYCHKARLWIVQRYGFLLRGRFLGGVGGDDGKARCLGASGLVGVGGEGDYMFMPPSTWMTWPVT